MVKTGWSYDEDFEEDTIKINAEPEVWDELLRESVSSVKKYGWFRRHIVCNWSLLEKVFGKKVATGKDAVSSANIADNPMDEANLSTEDEDPDMAIFTQLTALPNSPTLSGFADEPEDILDDDDKLDLATRTGREVLGKRSANGQLRTPESTKKPKLKSPEPTKKPKRTAASKISVPIEDIATAMNRTIDQREREIDMREPAWKRALATLKKDWWDYFECLPGYYIQNTILILQRDALNGNSLEDKDGFLSFADLLLVSDGPAQDTGL